MSTAAEFLARVEKEWGEDEDLSNFTTEERVMIHTFLPEGSTERVGIYLREDRAVQELMKKVEVMYAELGEEKFKENFAEIYQEVADEVRAISSAAQLADDHVAFKNEQDLTKFEEVLGLKKSHLSDENKVRFLALASASSESSHASEISENDNSNDLRPTSADPLKSHPKERE